MMLLTQTLSQREDSGLAGHAIIEAALSTCFLDTREDHTITVQSSVKKNRSLAQFPLHPIC